MKIWRPPQNLADQACAEIGNKINECSKDVVHKCALIILTIDMNGELACLSSKQLSEGDVIGILRKYAGDLEARKVAAIGKLGNGDGG